MSVDIKLISRPSSGISKHKSGTISEINEFLNVQAIQEHERKFSHLSSDYLPVFVGGALLALDKDCEIFDKAILEAITQGICIQTPFRANFEHLNPSRTEPLQIIDITSIQKFSK